MAQEGRRRVREEVGTWEVAGRERGKWGLKPKDVASGEGLGAGFLGLVAM